MTDKGKEIAMLKDQAKELQSKLIIVRIYVMNQRQSCNVQSTQDSSNTKLIYNKRVKRCKVNVKNDVSTLTSKLTTMTALQQKVKE